jgi:uncharacterized SAM-dependent methyltransferase
MDAGATGPWSRQSNMPPQPLAVEFHPSAFPQALQERLAGSLRSGVLPPRFLYESPAQAARWLAYHQAWSPSRKEGGVIELYRHAFRAAAKAMPSQALVYAGLGCGGGQKDREALAELLVSRGAIGGSVHYVPLDVSPSLVLESALAVRARWPALPRHPLVADLTADPNLRDWRAGHGLDGIPTLFSAFGLLPNMEPERFTAWLASLLDPGDRLLVSANLSPAGFAADRERILRQYDNAEARAWYGGALREIGVEAGHGVPIVEAENLSGDGSFWCVVVHATPRERVTFHLPDTSAIHEAGTRLRIFHSNRFTFEAARSLLERAGLAVAEAWQDGTGEEGVFLCGRERGE